MILIKSICKAIEDYSVLQGSFSHFNPSSHVNDMRSLQEGILTGVRWFLSPVYTEEADPCSGAAGCCPKSWQSPPAPCSASPSSLLLVWSVWPLHLLSSRSPSNGCFLSTDLIYHPWSCTAMDPSSLSGSQLHSAASECKHDSWHPAEQATPFLSIRSLPQHHYLIQPWDGHLKIKVLRFPSKLKLFGECFQLFLLWASHNTENPV